MRVDAGLSGVINAGQSDIDDGLCGIDARMHPAASCQSINLVCIIYVVYENGDGLFDSCSF